MTWTDEELVAKSIGGDADSFNELVLRWERPIYALAYRTIGREEDERGVCQEPFLRAFRALPGFRGQAKFSSWLYRIALNLCRDWIRRERRERGGAPLAGGATSQSRSARGAEYRNRAEGVPRADVSGDRGSRRVSAEHGEDALVSGAHGI